MQPSIPNSPFYILFKDDEFRDLSENMKFVGTGKKILISNSKISTDAPSSDFDITPNRKTKRSTRHKRQGRGCSSRVVTYFLVMYYEGAILKSFV